MTTTTPALVADGPGAPFIARQVERRTLGADDVSIAISHAGICHSDIHQVREEWGTAIFPMVPGHEIAGVVTAVGDTVTQVKVGDRVGVGCMVDSCGECEMCKDGFEQHCERGAVMTYNGRGYDGEPTLGGYSQSVVVSERFVCPIPEGIGMAEAAPLLCAGVTTYSPLKRWGVGPGTKVGVVGLGGLGHMGVKFAAAMGAEVTVFSRTSAKATDALALGAVEHVATSDPQALRPLRNRFDVVLNTVSADLDMNAYLRTVKPRGVLVNVGLPTGDYALKPGLLVGNSRVFAGSNIGGIPETREMLEFAARHGIGATVEVIDAADVTAAYDKVVAGDVRYRYVIDVSTIRA
ncbi:NAD(P)-dependent alcohol dehydrogenase [Nocardioides alcanivorans]|uniref:NAD(P)-dependent alcohol dehydrogenase n=1 Tax=Nocardioides alcanivorans TaxID=2897352 RepID=UPI001F47F725|nr:NAD(P)-dependent alcohol dehydrogenase [Nocardioides alcanivorans]